MSLQLLINRDYENDLVYLINGKYYGAVTLTPYQLPSGSTLIKLLEWTDQDLQNISSRPLFVLLNRDRWTILEVLTNGSLMTVAQSNPLKNNEIVINATIFKLPDLSSIKGDEIAELPKRDFPMEIYERFVFMVNNGMKLNQFDEAFPEVGVRPEDIPQPIPGLPGGSVGLSDRVTSGNYSGSAPVSIRRSVETALSEPGSPSLSYDGVYEENETLREISSPLFNGMQSPLENIGNPPRLFDGQSPSSPLNYEDLERQGDIILQRQMEEMRSRTGYRQPSSGGLRVEQMERDAIFSHGLSFSPVDSPVRSPVRSPEADPLLQQSYETLMKQIYNLPVKLPPYLVINNIPTYFINFDQAGQLLSTGQVERFILDPILQPWAGHPFLSNRIIRLFDLNGNSYLVKANYDFRTGQIYPPI